MKRKRTKFICYLIAAICYICIAVANFFDHLVAEGILHLCLGAINTVLCIEYACEHENQDTYGEDLR